MSKPQQEQELRNQLGQLKIRIFDMSEQINDQNQLLSEVAGIVGAQSPKELLEKLTKMKEVFSATDRESPSVKAGDEVDYIPAEMAG